MEDGRLTDAKGRTVNFRNTVLIMTSNLGASQIGQGTTVGFVPNADKQDKHQEMKKEVMEAIKKAFRPEFLNRLDGIIIFHALYQEQLKKITTLLINQVIAVCVNKKLKWK